MIITDQGEENGQHERNKKSQIFHIDLDQVNLQRMQDRKVLGNQRSFQSANFNVLKKFNTNLNLM